MRLSTVFVAVEITRSALIVVGVEAWGWGFVHRPFLVRSPVIIGTSFRDILKFLMEVSTAVMVTNKSNIEGIWH